MLGLVHMRINFDSFVRSRSLNLLSKYSSETTRLSAGRPSALQLANAVALTRRKIQKFMRFCYICFARGKNTRRKSFAKAEVKVFGGQNVVICCVESVRDPVHSASLEERKGWNSLDKFRC